MRIDKSPLQSRAIKCAYQKAVAPIRTRCPNDCRFLNLGSALASASALALTRAVTVLVNRFYKPLTFENCC